MNLQDFLIAILLLILLVGITLSFIKRHFSMSGPPVKPRRFWEENGEEIRDDDSFFDLVDTRSTEQRRNDLLDDIIPWRIRRKEAARAALPKHQQQRLSAIEHLERGGTLQVVARRQSIMISPNGRYFECSLRRFRSAEDALSAAEAELGNKVSYQELMIEN